MKDYNLDEKTLGIQFEGEGNASRVHRIVLHALVLFFRSTFSDKVNYDHVHTTVPKSQVPLTFRGKRYDISFVYDDRVVFVQVDTRPYMLPKSLRGEKDAKGQG